MKRQNSLYTTLLFAWLAASTAYAQPGKSDIIKLSIQSEKMNDSGRLSEFLTDVKLIPLETTKASLIGSIDKAVIARERIYILDKKSQKLLLFNLTGKFTGQVGQMGKGPGEYVEIEDFLVDADGKKLYILDFKNIHAFSLDGKFIKTFRLSFGASDFTMAGLGKFAFFGISNHDRLVLTNEEFTATNSFFPYSLAYRLNPSYPLTVFGSNPVVHIPGVDTLFTIRDEKPIPKFVIDFDGRNFTQKDFDRLSPADQNNLFDYILKGGKYIRCLGFLPLENQVFMTLVYSNNPYWGIYNLATNNYRFAKMKSIENDIFGSFIYLHPKGLTKSEFIFAVPPDKLIKDKNSKFYAKYKSVLDGVDELSNPLLLLAKPINRP